MARPARAAVIIVHEGRVALIERHREGLDYWILPGGGVEPGETLEQAAAREALAAVAGGGAWPRDCLVVQTDNRFP